MSSLDRFTTLTFDCYGTLIDWETGIWDALQPLIATHRGDVERDAALRTFAGLESREEAENPTLLYPEILRRVHAALARELDLETSGDLDAAFGASLPHWPAFADTAGALRRLARKRKLVILSNVDRAGFAASNRKLGVTFDAIYTAEEIGSYKPDPRNFDFLLERLRSDLGVEPHQVLHTAQSLFHDHAPAIRRGLATCWIDRQGLAEGGSWGATAEIAERPRVDFRFRDLASLADAVDAAGSSGGDAAG